MRLLLLATIVIFAHAAIDKRCGLPPNYKSLPEFAIEELNAIWKDYVSGTPCKKEIELTDEILKVLDEFGNDFETDTADNDFVTNDSSSSSSTSTETTTLPSTDSSSAVRQTFVSPASLRSQRLKTSTYAPRDDTGTTPDYRRIASSTITPYDEYYDYHDAAPTQGKVAKSLKKIGSPAFKDYGDIELLRDRKRQRFDENAGNFFRTTHRPTAFHSRNTATTRKFQDYDLAANDNTDDFNVHFDTPNAPFLKDVSPSVREEFIRLWSNEDVPSESLRAEKVHLLAVSLLNAQQLEAYNTWATNRKKALRAREQEMQNLSPRARSTLRRLARQNDERLSISPRVKNELMTFARRLETRRLRRVRARRS